MKKIIKAFTLIELIVGITISMMLMVSVGIFISNGMSSILSQQKVLNNTEKLTDFTSKIHTSINLMDSGSIFPITTNSGIIFKRGVNLGEGGFSYIGTTKSQENQNQDGIYCESGAELVETEHMFLKNFIPFEEQGENIFNNYTGNLTASGGTDYISYQKEHIVRHKNGTDIIGKGVFGNKFIEDTNGTGIYLNSPTGLAMSGSNILFISDTLNNRILWYDISANKINILLDESDGLNEPTGLYYYDYSLYISNSGNGEILKYSSKSEIQPSFIELTGINQNDINKIEIEFLDTEGNIQNINTIDKNDIAFIPDIKKANDSLFIKSGYEIKYYFGNSLNSESEKSECSTGNEGKYVLNPSDIPIKCSTTETLTGQLVNLYNNNLSSTTIKITNINTLNIPSNYYTHLKLYKNDIEKYSKYYHYFTKSDNDLTTPDDNILKIIDNELDYPTGIWKNGGNIVYNQFGDGGYSNLQYNPSDYLLETPINYLNIYKDSGLISLVLKYYKRYNCYNLDDNSEKTYIFKKNIK